MTNRFSIFTSIAVAAVWGAISVLSCNAVAAEYSNTLPAADLFNRAQAKLRLYSSIGARVRHRTHAFGHDLVGVGEFLQGPADSRLLRFEMKSAISSGPSALLQIADGQFLWIQRQLPNSNVIHRVDLAPVEAFETERAAPLAPAAAISIARGGLPRLLQNLERSFTFKPGTQARLGSLPGYVTVGTWTPAMQKRMAPDQTKALDAGQPLNWKPIPAHIPDRVSVFFGRDDDFPYQIKYERLMEEDGKEAVTPVSTMEFYEVRLNGKLDPSKFVFKPAADTWSDQTALYLESLR